MQDDRDGHGCQDSNWTILTERSIYKPESGTTLAWSAGKPPLYAENAQSSLALRAPRRTTRQGRCFTP